MAIDRSVGQALVSTAEAQLARIGGAGCARHPHVLALTEASGPHTGRDLSDAVHLLCSLHGRHPGVIELALTHCTDELARPWLSEAAEAFERERLFLVRLTAAVGPVPSTPGAAETEASLLAQRHAIETLSASERRGCALGAATALIGDWPAIRRILDRAAGRVGLDPPPSSLPDQDSVLGVIGTLAGNAAAERAIAFGGEQMLLQHRALFDLLEARAEARSDY